MNMDNVKHLNNFSNAINMFKIKLCKLFVSPKNFTNHQMNLHIPLVEELSEDSQKYHNH